MIKSVKNCQPYSWGENCTGWPLVQKPGLSIIQETMPPGTKEAAHYHSIANQFFYILKGTADFNVKDETFTVNEFEGIYIEAKTHHQIVNNSGTDLEFVVISQPSTQSDRIEEPFSVNDDLNINQKQFRVVKKSGNGEVDNETIFHYRQEGNVIWATYKGGGVLFGTLNGQIIGDKLEFFYQHQNENNEFLTGKCKSVININQEGKYVLKESWQWTCDDFSTGESVLIEI